jgi:hypothetical protein
MTLSFLIYYHIYNNYLRMDLQVPRSFKNGGNILMPS